MQTAESASSVRRITPQACALQRTLNAEPSTQLASGVFILVAVAVAVAVREADADCGVHAAVMRRRPFALALAFAAS